MSLTIFFHLAFFFYVCKILQPWNGTTVNIYWAPEEHYGLSILDTANSLYASCPVLLPSAHYINNSITVIASRHILHFRASCSNSDLSSIVVCAHISLCVWEREQSWTLHIALQNDVQITFHVTASVYVYMCTCPCPQWDQISSWHARGQLGW